MAVAFRSISNTTYASRTNTTITAPAGIVDGDILLLFFFGGQAGGSPPSPTPPSGFASLGTPTFQEGPGPFSANFWAYWKLASGESGNYTVTHAACSSQGVVVCYSGAATSPISPSATTLSSEAANTTNTATGLTTLEDNTMLVFAGADFADTGNNLTAPTGFDERLDVAPLTYVADDIQAAAGASGNKTMTCNSASGSPRYAWLVPLIPDAGGGGLSIPIAYHHYRTMHS